MFWSDDDIDLGCAGLPEGFGPSLDKWPRSAGHVHELAGPGSHAGGYTSLCTV